MPKRVLQGVVVSDKNDKTVVVEVERRYTHPLFKKTVRRTMEWGRSHRTSRTSDPATRSSKGATRGPTPLRDVMGAKSGNRISGRMLGAYLTGAQGRVALYPAALDDEEVFVAVMKGSLRAAPSGGVITRCARPFAVGTCRPSLWTPAS